MKKIILLVGMVINSLVFSQIKKIEVEKCIEIGGVKPFGATHVVLEKCPNDKYRFTYQDSKFTKITEHKSFEVVDKDGTVIDYLYNEIMNGLKTTPTEPIRLELENDIIELHFEKYFGVGNVKIFHWVNKNPDIIGVSIHLDKKKVNKLFNK